MNKLDVFETELNYLKDECVREFAEVAINSLPDYFFVVPASSTGKYHPNYSLGEGGLVRHTKAAVRIAVELLRLEMFGHFTFIQKDLLLVALLLHDGYKSGRVQQKYTVTEHPLIAEEELRFNPALNGLIPEEWRFFITEAIVSHMGQWNMDYNTKREILPKPRTESQKFVHLCDYLASRKCLEMNFDVPVGN